MSAYIVVNLDVTDPDMFARYREVVVPLVMAKGGKYLVVDFDRKDMDGQSRQGFGIIEFASVQAAEDFYNCAEYQKIAHLRLNSTEGWLRIVPELQMS
jgi:uncharacterized protein (DUF1330 family)